MLIYSPTDGRFSGTVWADPMNPTAGFDIPVIWDRSFEYATRDNGYFAREGDIVVQWTTKAVAVDFLKRWDPARYEALNWPYSPTEPGGNSSPYDGITYDVASQIGALIASNGPRSPLQKFDVRRVIETGFSQDGGFVFNQANLFHELARLKSGRPIYDGYVPQGSTGTGDHLFWGLNFGLTPAGSLDASDPRVKMGPRRAPVIKLNTETELIGGSPFETIRWRRPDSDRPVDPYPEWEVGGSSHDDIGDLFSPSYLEAIGTPSFDYAGCDHVGDPKYVSPTDYPYNYVANAAYEAVEQWIVTGAPPRRVSRLEQTNSVDPTRESLSRDRFGNALGGVRTPLLTVPIATYSAVDMPTELGCSLNGWSTPFSAKILNRLYGSHDECVSRFVQSARRAVRRGTWLAADARAAIQDARRADVL